MLINIHKHASAEILYIPYTDERRLLNMMLDVIESAQE